MSVNLELADTALRSARLLGENGDQTGAINRAYYAFFDAARAVLVEVARFDVKRIKTHSGVIRQFNLLVVKPGLVAKDMGAIFGNELDIRILYDYGDGVALAGDSANAIANAEAFVAACRSLVSSRRTPA